MTTYQTSLTGDIKAPPVNSQEIRNILETYPATEENNQLFYWLLFKKHCGWIVQLPIERQAEVKAFCLGIENARRRKQEHKNAVKPSSFGQ